MFFVPPPPFILIYNDIQWQNFLYPHRSVFFFSFFLAEASSSDAGCHIGYVILVYLRQYPCKKVHHLYHHPDEQALSFGWRAVVTCVKLPLHRWSNKAHKAVFMVTTAGKVHLLEFCRYGYGNWRNVVHWPAITNRFGAFTDIFTPEHTDNEDDEWRGNFIFHVKLGRVFFIVFRSLIWMGGLYYASFFITLYWQGIVTYK